MPAEHPTLASKGSLLIVDDELSIAKYMGLALGREGFQVLTACNAEESAGSVVKWVTALGDRARYLSVLNRKALEVAPADLGKRFADRLELGWPSLVPAAVPEDPIKTVALTSMEAHAREALKRLGKRPSKAIKEPKLPVLIKIRAQSWRNKFHAQLAGTGWFSVKGQAPEAAAAK